MLKFKVYQKCSDNGINYRVTIITTFSYAKTFYIISPLQIFNKISYTKNKYTKSSIDFYQL